MLIMTTFFIIEREWILSNDEKIFTYFFLLTKKSTRKKLKHDRYVYFYLTTLKKITIQHVHDGVKDNKKILAEIL